VKPGINHQKLIHNCLMELVFTHACSNRWFNKFLCGRELAVADPDQAFGGQGSQIGRRQKGLHLFKCQRLSATIVGFHTKAVTFCRPKRGYFCWSNYVIFQGITKV